uniref:Retrovirus-related Pol polyprotein from transposon TNT 1-94 n=1 Tax=Cajanus cajan TaxID=3821 RepID=A0A151TYP2_CAJCA|nr:hypothetical protein KK1_004754 [Cajanus cajan]KYP72182.1 hypothetical protein KK1_004768 [Cajanus cajan]
MISSKLDETNFLIWRQQVEPVIKAHRLQHFVVCPKNPLRFLNETDRDAGKLNPEYIAWEQQDQILMLWLQSSLSPTILSRVLGSNHLYQVWDKIHDYFHKQTRARARQLRTELRSTSLEEKPMEEFLLRIKALVDALASFGESVSL